MTNEQIDIYHDMLRTKMNQSQLRSLEMLASNCRYTSTLLHGIVDLLESQRDFKTAEVLADFVVNTFAPLEAETTEV